MDPVFWLQPIIKKGGGGVKYTDMRSIQRSKCGMRNIDRMTESTKPHTVHTVTSVYSTESPINTFNK